MLLTQVNDLNSVAELFLACADLRLKSTMEATDKVSIYLFLFVASFSSYQFSMYYDVIAGIVYGLA